MSQNIYNKLPNTNQLLLILLSKGFSEKVALTQINELSEIIWLSALNKIAKDKKLDLANINNADSREKLKYIDKNVTEKELSRALEIESEEKITVYLKAINS